MIRYAFGTVIGADKIIKGVPEGAKVRLRIRGDDFAIAYVRTDTETAAYAIEDLGNGDYSLGFPIALNRKEVKVAP